MSESMQACSKCTAEHPVSHFHRTGPGGRFSRCEACRQPERRHEKRSPGSPEQTRRSNLRRLYGITPEEYDALRAKQDYRCAICSRHEDGLPDRKSGRPRLDGKPSAEAVRLQVDHDHDTNAIRGLLCWQCNTGIGCFEDQPDRMEKAMAYVMAAGTPSVIRVLAEEVSPKDDRRPDRGASGRVAQDHLRGAGSDRA